MRHNISIFCDTYAKLAKVDAGVFEHNVLYPQSKKAFTVNSQVFFIDKSDDEKTITAVIESHYILVGKMFPATVKDSGESSGIDFTITIESL